MELSDITWAIQLGSLSAQNQANRWAAERARADAEDHSIAAAIHRGAARGHAEAAAELRMRLHGAEAEIERLRDVVEDLRHERTQLLQGAADILAELDELRARAH